LVVMKNKLIGVAAGNLYVLYTIYYIFYILFTHIYMRHRERKRDYEKSH
jgi:hypothetical protein